MINALKIISESHLKVKRDHRFQIIFWMYCWLSFFELSSINCLNWSLHSCRFSFIVAVRKPLSWVKGSEWSAISVTFWPPNRIESNRIII